MSHPFPCSMDALFLAMAILFFASFVQGLSGFGFSLVALPLLVLFINPVLVVPVLLVHSAVLNAFILFESRKHADFKNFWPVLVAGTLATPLGVLLLKFTDPEVIKILIGLVIVLFSLVLLFGYSVSIRKEKPALFLVGLASGILNGSTTLSGPPVVIFYQNQKLPKSSFRANLVMYFLSLNIISIPIFVYFGILDGTSFFLSLKVIPGLLGGSILGILLSRKTPESLFRKIVLGIVVLAGMLAIASGFGIV